MALNLFANKADLEAAQSQIASLENDLQTAQSELQAERETVATQAQQIADLQSSLQAVSDEKAHLQASITEAETAIQNLTEKLTAAENSAPAKAAEILGSVGVPALDIVEDKPENKSKSLKEFNALTPAARMNFIKTGGKISD